LLRYFKWNKEKLVEKYMDSPEQVLKMAGISTDIKVITVKDKEETFVCEICCDDDPEIEIVSLTCGHKFCKTCYIYYTSQKIKEGENRPIQCPQDGCNITMDAKTVGLLVEPEVLSR
jgi:ariadne-1